jgi:putative hydrolase of the HAD superfamily
MPRLEAITFDLWDTLIQEVPRKNPTLGKVRVKEMRSKLRSFGYDYSIESMERAYSQSGEYCEEAWGRRRDMPADDHLLFMLTCVDPKLPSRLGKDEYEVVRQVYTGTLLRHPPVLMDGVERTLDALRSKGYSIGMISNTGRTPGDVLRVLLTKMKIDQYFDHMTFSNEVLIRKPEKEIFLSTLRIMRAAPKSSMHVGDDLDIDCAGAKAAGMKAVLLDREKGHTAGDDVIHSLPDLLGIL